MPAKKATFDPKNPSDDPADYIGLKMRAMVGMNLPKGRLAPGDEFVFTATLAKHGYGPQNWVRAGSVEVITAPKSIGSKPKPKAEGSDS